MEDLERPPLVGAIQSIFYYRRLVDNNAGTHGCREGHLLHIDAFRGSWLALLQVSQQGCEVVPRVLQQHHDLQIRTQAVW